MSNLYGVSLTSDAPGTEKVLNPPPCNVTGTW